MASSPYALGVYVGNPYLANPTAQSQFNADFSSFVATLGVTPTYSDAYVDQNMPVNQWVNNASFIAQQYALTPDTQHITPVIGLPLASLAPGSESQDAFFKDFASGKYDSVIQGVVKAWASEGYSNQVWRPGWEMNLSSSPSFAGNDAATQADWVKAFQHVSDVLHQAGQTDGVKVQVVWNPGTINYTNAEATTNLYPGNQYVDVIGADVYSDAFPYGNTNAIYNWDASGDKLNSSTPVYSTLQQWAADPVNLEHYYTDPASTQYSLDGSGGHSLSLQNIIDFAKAEGKPLAIEETGAGSTSDGAGVSDNAAFVQWLSNTLANAGVPIENVNIWDNDGGGDYKFSSASDDKPAEAAAWASDFGAQATPAPAISPATSPAVVSTATTGAGSDTLVLELSEDAFQGDAQATISVDGTQVGGVRQITAAHSAGAEQTLTIGGNWGSGPHTVSVDFLNDQYQPGVGDRNLYVDGATYDGNAAKNPTLTLLSAGSQSLLVQGTIPATVAVGSGSDTIDLNVAEDAFQGDAQFTVSVDGVQVGGTQTAQGSQSTDTTQDFKVEGNWAAGPHQVSVDFLNDLYQPGVGDRNLYVDGTSLDGVSQQGGTLSLLSGGTQSLTVQSLVPATVAVGSGPDTVDLKIAEDAFQGNAQFTVSVDGAQVGDTQTARDSQSSKTTQDFKVEGNWGAGPHQVSVDFLNDLYQPGAGDRNLYVDGATYDGINTPNSTLLLLSGGTQSLTLQGPAPATVVVGSGSDTIDLDVAEDAFQGNAQFTVSVDGVQVGGTQTAEDSQSAKATQDFKIEGNWGAGPHKVAIDFLNDVYQPGVGDRNLYVDNASYDGAPQQGGALSLLSGGTQTLQVVSATTYNEGAAGGVVTTLGNDNVTATSGAVTIHDNGPSLTVQGGSGQMTFIGGTGTATIVAGSGATTITGASGALTYTAGTGNATINASTGTILLNLISGQAGGSLQINGFVSGTDILHLSGYSGNGVKSEQVVGGSTIIQLVDSTKITLAGFTANTSHPVFG